VACWNTWQRVLKRQVQVPRLQIQIQVPSTTSQLVHHAVCLFTPQLSPLRSAPTHGGMARLSNVADLPICERSCHVWLSSETSSNIFFSHRTSTPSAFEVITETRYINYLLTYLHVSSDRARRRVTSSIESNALQTKPNRREKFWVNCKKWRHAAAPCNAFHWPLYYRHVCGAGSHRHGV